jgi:BolA protein
MNYQAIIEERLRQQFDGATIDVVNESHMHNVPPDSQTHFKVTVVTPMFAGVRKVKRHQLVYQLLQDLLDASLHALALHLYDPGEWGSLPHAPQSPACHGGEAATPEG